MKRILVLILLFAGIGLNGQTITGDKVITRTQLELAGYKVTGISNDTLMGDNSIMKLVTQYAVKNYVANYVTANSLPSQVGNSGKYLTTNGTVASWGTITPTAPSGSSGQVQYNNSGAFGANDSITMVSNPDRLGIGVPVPTARLDIRGSGSTSATNALRVRNSLNAEALRVQDNSQTYITDLVLTNGQTNFKTNQNIISNYAGGVPALDVQANGSTAIGLRVAQASTTVASQQWCNGSYVALSNMSYDGRLALGSSAITTVGLLNNFATTASTPSMLLSGTGFSGGTATTTKPTFLIEPAGTTTTAWSTSGTKLGVNAETGFTGNLADFQVNGVSKAGISATGNVWTNRLETTSWRTSLSYEFYQPTTMTSSVHGVYFANSTFTGANTTQHFIDIATTINKTGTGGYNLIASNVTETSLGSTENNYLLHKIGGVNKFRIKNDGSFISVGGTTSSDPAIKKNGTGIDVRLADDSGYAPIQSLYDRFGSGSPESVVTAPVGAVYHRTDGGAGTSFYVKESGTGNTGWVAK